MRKKSWVHGLILIGGLIGCGGKEGPSGEHEAKPAKGEEAAEAHVEVRTEPARRGTVAETVEGLGRCEALPDHLATLTPAVEGHVHELLVKEGDPVKKGQAIVELDKAVALADLAEKTATRDGLKASLLLLKSVPRPEERKANELAIEQAKLTVERTQRIADHLRPLHASHAVSEQQVYEADQAAAQARLQHQTADAQLKAMMIGPRAEAVAEAVAKIATADAAVALSKARLEFDTIRSPIDGVLDSLTCHPGQTIAVGTVIGEVVDTRQVFATVWLQPRSARLVRPGQATQVGVATGQQEEASKEEASKVGSPTEGSPKEGSSKEEASKEGSSKEGGSSADGGEASGKVAFVGQVADTQTGNLPVRILVDNPEGRLALGETVRVAITVDEKAGVLQVPAVAIFDQGEGPVLTVVREGKSVLLHPELGSPHEGWVAVSGTDLKEGEPVVVEGGYNLPEGTPVKTDSAKTVARAEAPR